MYGRSPLARALASGERDPSPALEAKAKGAVKTAARCSSSTALMSTLVHSGAFHETAGVACDMSSIIDMRGKLWQAIHTTQEGPIAKAGSIQPVSAGVTRGRLKKRRSPPIA